MEKFKLPYFCKEQTEICNCKIRCYPVVLLERINEESLIPKKYWKCEPSNLPIETENPTTYKRVMRYLERVEVHVKEGLGLYLHSIPNENNLLGCGNGKTSTACTLANFYMKKRVVEHVKAINKIKENPVLFLSVPKLQNIYNSQFAGTSEMKEASSDTFKKLFQMALKAELLILDDVALRGAETFLNFIYELIDERNNEEKAIFITSNVPLYKVTDFLGERITSRIEECTTPLAFEGKDYRRGLLFE